MGHYCYVHFAFVLLRTSLRRGEEDDVTRQIDKVLIRYFRAVFIH